MKSEKGFTLISVIVYILCLIIAISTVMMINSFFFADVMQMSGTGEIVNQYNKFNMFFIQDIREAKSVDVIQNGSISSIQIVKKDSKDEIIYINYTLNNNAIYRDNVKIVENVSNLNARLLSKSEIESDIQEDNIIGVEIYLELSVEEQMLNYTTDYYIGRGY